MANLLQTNQFSYDGHRILGLSHIYRPIFRLIRQLDFYSLQQ